MDLSATWTGKHPAQALTSRYRYSRADPVNRDSSPDRPQYQHCFVGRSSQRALQCRSQCFWGSQCVSLRQSWLLPRTGIVRCFDRAARASRREFYGFFFTKSQNVPRYTYISMPIVATPAGFEPATCPLGGGCSIQLSHGTTRASV